MAGKALFDSNILIGVCNKRIDPTAFWLQFGTNKRYISVITELELLSHGKLSDDNEKELKVFLREFRCLPLSAGIKREVIRFRRACNRKLPDSIIAASAITRGITLISNDSDLLSVQYPGLTVKPFVVSQDKTLPS